MRATWLGSIGVATILVASSPAFAAAAGRLPLEAVPERYAITLAPHLDAGTFDGVERIALRVPRPTATVTLNAADLTHDARAAVGGNVATVTEDAASETATLTFATPLGAGTAQLDLAWQAKLSDKLRGFYRRARGPALRRDAVRGDRRAARLPVLRRAGVQGRLHVRSPSGRRHGDLEHADRAAADSVDGGLDGPLRDDAAAVVRTSCALAVGAVRVAWSGRRGQDVPIRVCTCRESGADRRRLAPPSGPCRFYEKYFGIALPVRASSTSSPCPTSTPARWRTPALITYRENELLADERRRRSTAQDSASPVIAHEMAHQWFGDLVTMQWWDDLWLNEAFATLGGEPRRGGAASDVGAVAGVRALA